MGGGTTHAILGYQIQATRGIVVPIRVYGDVCPYAAPARQASRRERTICGRVSPSCHVRQCHHMSRDTVHAPPTSRLPTRLTHAHVSQRGPPARSSCAPFLLSRHHPVSPPGRECADALADPDPDHLPTTTHIHKSLTLIPNARSVATTSERAAPH